MSNYFKFLIILAIIFFVTISTIIITYLSNPKIKENFTSRKTIDDIKIYVINLEESKDRLRLMKSQCDREKINLTRWNATNGRNLDNNKLKPFTVDPNIKLSPGVIGCSLSHINLWKHCSGQDDEVFLVLEDDCIIPNNFKNKLQSYMGQLPSDWDIFFLGASNIYGTKYSRNILVPSKFSSTYNTGTYAMLIKKKMLPYLIKDSFPIKEPIDIYLRNKISKNKVFIAYPPIITHNNKIYSPRRMILPKWKAQSNIKII